jgi:hypothetical protein
LCGSFHYRSNPLGRYYKAGIIELVISVLVSSIPSSAAGSSNFSIATLQCFIQVFRASESPQLRGKSLSSYRDPIFDFRLGVNRSHPISVVANFRNHLGDESLSSRYISISRFVKQYRYNLHNPYPLRSNGGVKRRIF